MKIALCLSGHLRSYKITYGGWKQHLLSKYDVDVFLHTWDTTGFRIDGDAVDGDTAITKNNSIDIDDIIKTFSPVSLVIEKQEKFSNLFAPRVEPWYNARNELGLRTIDRPLSNLLMYYKWWRCNKIKNEWMRINNIHYDLVIRTRPDIRLNGFIPDICFSDSSVTYIPKAGSWGSDEISDYMTIGTNEQIDHWCEIFNLFDTKYQNALTSKNFTTALYPHKLFYHHFVDYNQQFKELDIPCEIIR